jgi:hypothetical protein
MTLNDDGDIVRAYGYVAIYFAELEDRIDDLFGSAESLIAWPPGIKLKAFLSQNMFRRKVNFISQQLAQAFNDSPDHYSKMEDGQLTEGVLAECLKALDDRNEVLHSPIISDMRKGEIIRHSKAFAGRPESHYLIDSKSTYELADRILDLSGGVSRIGFCVNHLLQARAGNRR